MRTFNPNIYPPSGYQFVDSDGHRHRSESWRKLEEMVREYRARNQLAPGNPWEEIMGQVCAETPGFCNEQSPAFVLQPDRSGMEFNQRVLAWLGHAAGFKRLGQWKRVSDVEAAARAACCAACPAQKALNAACGACMTSVKALRSALLDGESPKHQNLHPCGALFEDCQSTVHTQLPAIDKPELPTYCWRRKP